MREPEVGGHKRSQRSKQSKVCAFAGLERDHNGVILKIAQVAIQGVQEA
jgi:hypothetical protein